MKKRIVFITMLLLLTFCLTLVACKNADPTVELDPSTSPIVEPAPEHTHTFASTWSKDSTYHWHAATCEHTSEVNGKAVHSWNQGTITTPATVDAEGVKTFTCTVCEYSYDETIPKIAEHTISFIVDDKVYYTFSTKGKEKIVMPAEPTKNGNTFNGWYLDKDVWNRLITEDSYAEIELTSDISVYAKWVENSFVEKEQPELSDESKALIRAYNQDPTEENYVSLRNSVIANYNAVLVHKETKLAELKEETLGKPNGESIVAEMDEIVQDMYITYWEHINSSMLRFTDRRLLLWKIANASQYDYIPVMGAGLTVEIKRTPVTNAEYKAFIDATNHTAPSNWINGNYPSGQDDYPVNYVSYADCIAYCEWLSAQDGTNTYRLPNESEWELAAGHMPKDADFNAGNIYSGRTSVFEFDGITRGAHGAIDFWGNVWEWTTTERTANTLAVKGGSWKSDRTDCRTEHRKEGRNSNDSYDDVGFRIIKLKNGVEPAQKVELATLEAPTVTATLTNTNTITLSWNAITKENKLFANEAIIYQVFEYDTATQLFRMLSNTTDTSFVVENVSNPSKYRYVVQAVSYVEFSDNVATEYGTDPGSQV